MQPKSKEHARYPYSIQSLLGFGMNLASGLYEEVVRATNSHLCPNAALRQCDQKALTIERERNKSPALPEIPLMIRFKLRRGVKIHITPACRSRLLLD